MSFLLYGIVADGKPAKTPDESLVYIQGGGLFAVVAASGHISQDVESVLAFGKVVECIHRHTTIIPIRYGTLLPDADAVASHLSVMADDYRGRLAELAGCEEMGIRLPLPKPACPAKPAPPTASGRDYLQSLKRKYSATEQAEHQAAALNLALAGLYRKQRGETGLFNGEPMYLLSYLVPRDKLPVFRERLDALADSGHFQGTVSGPWPPYNFV